MESTCNVCQGALPDGAAPEGHTALCAEVVRQGSEALRARLGAATAALLAIARDVPHNPTDWCAHCYAAGWARKVGAP